MWLERSHIGPLFSQRRSRASATSAATRPAGSCSVASTCGSKPSARTASLVTGPIVTRRGPVSVPAASWKNVTLDALVKQT